MQFIVNESFIHDLSWNLGKRESQAAELTAMN